MTDSTSPFVLLRTATGRASVDVRTIAGNITHVPNFHERLYLQSTIADPTTLHFASAAQADDAVTLLHAVREQHDDARAEDARAKVVGEAIRESGREFTQQIADVFLQSVMGLKDVLASTFAAGDAFRKLGEPPTRACLLDAERVIADNIESLEAHPLGESICRCLRLIAVKPHLAPIYLSELLEAGKATQHETGSTPRDAMLPQVDAEEIIAYDLGREHPASEAIHACIRQIADKPHRTPLYLADLVRTSAQPRIITDALGVVEELRAGAMLRALDVHPSTLALLRSKGYVDTRVDEHGRFVVNLLQSDTVVEFVDWRDLPGVVWSGLRYAVRAFDGTLPSDVHIAHDLVFFGLVRQRGDKHELTPLGFLICESGKEV